MDSFVGRLIEEQVQLKEKIEKLAVFIHSEKFKEIKTAQQMLLTVQLKAMETYCACLEMRISNLS